MMLVELTTIPPTALPVAAFKEYLRLGSGFSDDGLQDDALEGYLRASVAAIEARTGKILISRTFSWTIFAWRDSTRQPLPLAPVISILGVYATDDDNVETMLSATSWRLQPDHQRPVLLPRGSNLPTVPSGGNVRIEMQAGFGDDWANLPADLSEAVMMLAAHFYEYRHETPLKGHAMPYGVTALIERYRTVRMFLGGGRS